MAASVAIVLGAAGLHSFQWRMKTLGHSETVANTVHLRDSQPVALCVWDAFTSCRVGSFARNFAEGCCVAKV